MINSSPEYAITKSGVRPLSRKRDKPLRTYGRQSTATPEPRSEPPAKRARVTYATPDDKNIKPLGIAVPEDDAPEVTPIFKAKPQPTVEQDQENTPPSKPEPNVPAKRSILNYFKPVTTHLTPLTPTQANVLPGVEPTKQKRVVEEKNAVEEQGAIAGKTGSEEEKVQQLSRPKRRLLRIRSNQSIDYEDEADENNGRDAENERDESIDAKKDEPRPGRKRRLGGGSSTSCDSRRLRRKPVSAEVQTTLNISNQAPFSECKICDTVWNPLYPDDVKYHTKRHAAQLRTKKKRGEHF